MDYKFDLGLPDARDIASTALKHFILTILVLINLSVDFKVSKRELIQLHKHNYTVSNGLLSQKSGTVSSKLEHKNRGDRG